MASKANRRKFLQVAGMGVAATATFQSASVAMAAESDSSAKGVNMETSNV